MSELRYVAFEGTLEAFKASAMVGSVQPLLFFRGIEHNVGDVVHLPEHGWRLLITHLMKPAPGSTLPADMLVLVEVVERPSVEVN